MPDFSYDAFVSYRRSDGAAVARWLRRELESFQVPKSLRERFGRRIKVYLDSAYERGTSDFYEQNIKPALLASHTLIVVATPAAVRRQGGAEDWIDREVRDFTAGPNGANVIAVRAAGEFGDPLPSDLATRFPNIEIVDLRGAGRFWFVNPISAARLASEKLKLAAPLLGIPPDEMPKLRREEERRQQTRLGAVIGATLGVLVAMSLVSVYALYNRYQAIRSLEDSMFAAGGMAQSAVRLNQEDEDVAGIRRFIINRGCDLVDKFGAGAVNDPAIADVVMCRLERARDHEQLKENDEARARFGEAIALADKRYRQQAHLDAGESLVDAREAYASYLKRQKDAAGARAEYGRLLDGARELDRAHPGIRRFARSQAEALGQLGDLDLAEGQRAKAADDYIAAAEAVERSIAERQGVKAEPEPRSLDWLARLQRLAGEQYVSLEQNVPAIEQFRRSLATRGRQKSRTPEIEQEVAVLQAQLFLLERKRGDKVAADLARKDALARAQAVQASPQASADTKKKAASLKQWLESQAGE